MYRTEPILPYANYYYAIMPPELPDRFYPEDSERVYKTDDYVICFDEDVSDEIKNQIIKDYAEYYTNEKASELFH